MSCFGFLSPLLNESASSWRRLLRIIPERWRFYKGPLRMGEITGTFLQRQVKGWGWKLPYKPSQIWDEEEQFNLWNIFLEELSSKEVKVVGLEAGSSFHPPLKLRTHLLFPGVSDGKALELLFFINRFRRLLQNYGITPGRVKVLIVWEEGNLGLSCARLIARWVRFLTLVSPNIRLLERAADVIMAETGVTPQVYSNLPPDYKGAKIIIKCGRVSQYLLYRCSRKVIYCALFPHRPNITNINLGLPFDITTKTGQLPHYPALGEAILRSCFEINMGFWYGPDLPLERVYKLAIVFKELGMEISL
jgi:hypothetical protein